MARPASDTEARLIQAGREIFRESGFSGLTLRAVAKRAKANLGHFAYYFKGKDDFTRQVSQGIYEEFFEGFSLEVKGQPHELEALRSGLLRLAEFTREHRFMAMALIKDVMATNPQAKSFLLKNGPRHGKVILGLVRRCQAKGLLRKMALPNAMAMLMGAVAVPNLMAIGLAAAAPKLPFGLAKRYIEDSILSDAALRERVDLILKALKA